MANCKNCEVNEAIKYSKYSSGQYCSKACACSYSTKLKRKEINLKVSYKLKETCKDRPKIIYEYDCADCGVHFENEYRLNKKRPAKCNNCRRKSPHKNLSEASSILELSNRTIAKIIKRANIACVMCGWDRTSLDLHHITPTSEGGSDNHDNLIAVCPNCHRLAHEYKYTKDELFNNCLSIRFSNWREFYQANRNLIED